MNLLKVKEFYMNLSFDIFFNQSEIHVDKFFIELLKYLRLIEKLIIPARIKIPRAGIST